MLQRLRPWQVVLIFHVVYLSLVLARHGGDAVSFAQLGHAPNQGYDGQFAYLIAENPHPADVVHEIQAVRADVPAYRYQRILLPWLARTVALGDRRLIPWALPLVNLIAQVIGTAIVTRLVVGLGVSPWYGLIYGLWPGLALGVRADLTEPLSLALVAGGYLLQRHGLRWPSAICLGLALFAKETAVLFVGAQLTAAILNRDWKSAGAYVAVAIVPFAIWQLEIRHMFGMFGIGSGGYLATSFEWIPFNGLLRVAIERPAVFAALLLVLVPFVIVPSIWGIAVSFGEITKRNWDPAVWALALNAAVIPFTPSSTFREPGAMLRLASGLVLSTLFFAALLKSRPVLKYGWLWLATLVFLRE